MSSDTEFTHLHVHTDYSLLDGCCRIDRLCSKAKDLGMKALSITDHGNLFGLASFFQTAKKYDIKPMLGCEIYLAYDHKMTEKPDRSQHKYHHMGLIAKNFEGYQNLTKLVSDAHVYGMYYKPRTDMEHLARHAKGLVGFTGCLQGVVPQLLLKKDIEGARKAMGEFIDIFGKENYFVEIQDHGIEEQKTIIPDLLKLGAEFGLKVVCSNDVHYVNNTDWQPHDSLVCIQTGMKLSDEKRLRYSSRQFYLKSRQEMDILFRECPEAVINTNAVAEMCELELPFGENHYPVFHPPIEIKAKHPTNSEYIKHLCCEGLKERYNVDYYNIEQAEDPTLAQTLAERLDYELGIIEKTGFLDYFLIVWDFIYWAREQKIPVGPGRGSGAGCIVAYLLKITDIDPIRFGLLFERFLNPERVSPPDFDIDFCMRRRGDVIEYVRQKYGKDSVANIITFGTFGAKMVIRDLARVLDIPYAEADRIAKMVPNDIGITIEEALEKSSELRREANTNDLVSEIITQGKVIEGMVRNTGTHAAGVIIADRPLTEFIPVTLQEGALTTQYPKDPVEGLGLLKMDFLGLKTLTIISDAQNNVQRTRKLTNFSVDSVGFEDEKTFMLLNEAKTVGVFQLESGGMQNLCKQFSISNIDEIVALIALYRPGPMEWIPDYIKGKKDPSTIKFPHPLLEDVCKETYGVMVYQEQVMEAARRIAGYTLGSADILRRAMGKKKVEEMEKQREIFIKGAKDHNDIPREKAEAIFSILEKFAGYGFNKSHSAAYAILAYQTAYLKANYPVEFMAAVLSNELGNADKVSHFIKECTAMGIEVLGPDINESREDFTPITDLDNKIGAIRFGMAAIKGVGDSAVKKILEERDKHGNFTDFIDFAKRIDTQTANRRIYESLIKSGSFDGTGYDRQHLLDSLDEILSEVSILQKDQAAGQISLFDLIEEPSENTSLSVAIKTDGPKMFKNELLQNERDLLGFYLSGHPLDHVSFLVEKINSFSDEDFDTLENKVPFRICGVISDIKKKMSKKDNRTWAFFTLSTQSKSYEINLFTDAYERYGNQLIDGAILVIQGTVRASEDGVRLNATELGPLSKKIPALIESMTWVLDPTEEINPLLVALGEYVHSNSGNTLVNFKFVIDNNKEIKVDIARSLRCYIDEEFFKNFLKYQKINGFRSLDIQIRKLEVKEERPRWGKKY